MKKLMALMAMAALAWTVTLTEADAQRGMGDPSGVGRQAEKPPLVSLSGKLAEIKTGPCEATTGRALQGTHLILEAADGRKLNVHLGPTNEVEDLVKKLSVGETVAVTAFRTEKMPDGHYAAQAVTVEKTTVELRDAKTLRPTWAGPGRGAPAANAQKPEVQDTPRGPGRGWGGPGRGWRGGGGPPWAGGGPGRGGRGADAEFLADREMFHFLLDNRARIERTVTKRADGIETLTESNDKTVASTIQAHAEAMHRRLKEGAPIHRRDPLFAAIFDHASKIRMEVVKTDQGVRVVETSKDPYVVKLIQAHAEVVSRFLDNGYAEVRQNHALPEEP